MLAVLLPPLLMSGCHPEPTTGAGTKRQMRSTSSPVPVDWGLPFRREIAAPLRLAILSPGLLRLRRLEGYHRQLADRLEFL
jgi:hypothetical protein